MSEQLPPHPDAMAMCSARRAQETRKCSADSQAMFDKCIAEGKHSSVCRKEADKFSLECIQTAGENYAACIDRETDRELLEPVHKELVDQRRAREKARLDRVARWMDTATTVAWITGGFLLGIAVIGPTSALLVIAGAAVLGFAVAAAITAGRARDAKDALEVRRDYQVSERATLPDYLDSVPPEAVPFGLLLNNIVLLSRGIDALGRSQGRLEGVAAAGQLSQVKTLDYANSQALAIAHNAFLANLANTGIARLATDTNRQLAKWSAEFGSAPTDVKAVTEQALQRDVPKLWDALGCTLAEKRQLLKAGDELLARLPTTETNLPATLIGNDFEKISAQLTKDLKRMREAAQQIHW